MTNALVGSLRCKPSLSVSLLLAALATNATGQVERYRLTVDNTWSNATHPGLFPPLAHFSRMAGGTHNASADFWSVGSLASPGMVLMAELGQTQLLEAEVAAAVMAGTAGSVLWWHHWFCPAETSAAPCGSLVVEFDVDASFPLVTLASMLGPTPDWFIGVDSLPLHDGNAWLDQVLVDLRPYDGGTRSANVFALHGPETLPPEAISLITQASGQLIGPASLGTFLFQRIDALASVTSRNGAGINPEDFASTSLPVLASDWTSSIATTPTVGTTTLLTAIGVSVVGPHQGTVLFGGDELLVLPPLELDVQLGAHSITIPAISALVGQPVFTQGLRVELGTGGQPHFVLTNALDLVIGY